MQPVAAKAVEELNIEIFNESFDWTKVMVTIFLVALAAISFHAKRLEAEKYATVQKLLAEEISRDREVVRLKSANLVLQEQLEQLENTMEEARTSALDLDNVMQQLRNATERITDQEGEIRRYQQSLSIFQHQQHMRRGPEDGNPPLGPPIPSLLEATPMGRCVHLPGCTYVSRASSATRIRQYRPCTHCFPQYVGHDPGLPEGVHIV